MTGHTYMSDEDIAGILTYIRQSWGNNASPVVPKEVARIRRQTSDRKRLWSPAKPAIFMSVITLRIRR